MTANNLLELEKTTTGSALAVRNLWKVYGQHPKRVVGEIESGQQPASLDKHVMAVRDVSFDVSPGETFVVMGLSGSGKSTLVRCLTRLVEPTAGSVTMDGVEILGMPPKQLAELRRKDWAMVFQHFGLLPHRRVLDNVAYSLEISGVPRSVRDARAAEMIELVGLEKVGHKFPHELSGGMRQRVGLARALAVGPRLLLLDEPFSALDPLIRTDLQDELLRLAKDLNQTSIFITHDLAEALKVGDRIAIMRDGQLVQIGTPEEIVFSPADDYVRRFAAEAPRAKLVRAGAVVKSALVATPSDYPTDVLVKLERAKRDVAIIEGQDGEGPRLLTERQLLRAQIESLRLGDIVHSFCATVNEDAKLSVVMEMLVETGKPVIVRSLSGQTLGYADEAAVVKALTISPATV